MPETLELDPTRLGRHPPEAFGVAGPGQDPILRAPRDLHGRVNCRQLSEPCRRQMLQQRQVDRARGSGLSHFDGERCGHVGRACGDVSQRERAEAPSAHQLGSTRTQELEEPVVLPEPPPESLGLSPAMVPPAGR